jgi:hypothetical protein
MDACNEAHTCPGHSDSEGTLDVAEASEAASTGLPVGLNFSRLGR